MRWKSNHSLLAILMTIVCLSQNLQADIIDDVDQVDTANKKKVVPEGPRNAPSGEVTKSDSEMPPIDLDPTEENRDSSSPDSGAKVLTKSRSPQESGQKKSDRRSIPIHLQSDGTSTYSKKGAYVDLKKNVIITQQDVRLQSDEARVQFQTQSEMNSVKSVEMLGHVSINRYSRDPAERVTARSDRAKFDNHAQKITLDGNARLWREGHLIKGDRIVYEINTGMVKVDRVQGVLQPEKVEKK